MFILNFIRDSWADIIVVNEKNSFYPKMCVCCVLRVASIKTTIIEGGTLWVPGDPRGDLLTLSRAACGGVSGRWR